MDIGQLESKRQTHVWEKDGETANLSWNPAKLTVGLEEKLEDMGDRLGTFVLFLTEIEFEWDVQRNGEPFPATEENLKTVSASLLGEIMSEIRKASSPSSEEGKG